MIDHLQMYTTSIAIKVNLFAYTYQIFVLIKNAGNYLPNMKGLCSALRVEFIFKADTYRIHKNTYIYIYFKGFEGLQPN